MTGGRPYATAVATVVVAVLVGGSLLAFAPTAVADPHENGSSAYTIEQTDCTDVDPVGDESRTVEDFYDYRIDSYSSHGTSEYQEDDTSTLLLYEGSEGTSLVVVHEKYHENESNGTRGGFATFTVTGIDPGDEWAVEDDDYSGQDDEFTHDENLSEMVWAWGEGRTDGGAYRGLDGDTEIVIDPVFNEDDDSPINRSNSPSYNGTVNDWDVVTATGDGSTREQLDALDEEVTIESGYCTQPDADLEVDDETPEVGETVTFDASESTSAADVTEYQWDVTGDGAIDETTTGPVFEHEFESAGERNVTVTVDDGYESDSASLSLDVSEASEPPGPTAELNAPETPTVGESVPLDASGSDAEADVDEYRWDVDGNGDVDLTTEDAAVEHTFTDAGERDVSVTVVDEHERTDTASASVEVVEPSEPDGPAAQLDAPGEATVDEPVTFDASGSDAGDNETYQWFVDGTATNASGSTYDHVFSTDGEHDVRVTVSDDYGSDSANATVTVDSDENDTDRTPPTARIHGPTGGSVGEELTFSGAESEDDSGVESYEWTFGDGETASGETVTHTYDHDGNYTVELTAVDAAGNDDTDSLSIDVTAANEPTDPTANLEAPREATVDEPVTFDASGSDAGDNETYQWFVDGTATNASGSTYDHAFSTDGEHDVRVTVSDDYGSDSANATVTVDSDENDTDRTPPTARLDGPAEGSPGEKLTFSGTESEDDSGVESYEWTFGDGETASGETVTHTYDHEGNYTVELTAVDAAGNDDTDSLQVEIAEPSDADGPTAQLELPESPTVDEPVTLDATDSDAGENATYEWTIDGTMKTTTDVPTYDHAFSAAGKHDICVVVTDDDGSDTAETTIAVDEGNDSDGSDSDDSNGGSSGSGGYGDAPQPAPDDPVETAVELENGTVIVTAANANAGESFAVDVPSPTNEGSAAGAERPGAGAVELRSVDIVPAHDAETLTIRFEPTNRSVPGRFAEPLAYVPNATAELEDVTYEFAADRTATTAAGVAAEDLVAYAGGEEWEAVETDVETGATDADTVIASATVEGSSPVGVGADGAVLLATDVVAVESGTANATVDLAVTVRNTGTESGELTVPVEVDGTTVREASVALAPGEETVVETSVSGETATGLAAETSDGGIRVAGARRDPTVVSMTAIGVSPAVPAPNESVTVETELVNRGSAAGAFDAKLHLDGEVVATEGVRLEPDERTTVAFDHRFASVGTYDLAAGNATETVRVEERDNFDADDGEEVASDATSGLGVLTAIVAVALVTLGVLGMRGRKRLRR